MSTWTGALPYFSERELACKHCGLIHMDLRFAAALPDLRRHWDEPLTPNSVCRCPVHNEAEGGHPRSLHLTENPVHPSNGTMAADLRWWGWEPPRQRALARLAYSLGWSVGLHDAFIHIDLRSVLGLTQRVFLYGENWSGDFDPEDIF